VTVRASGSRVPAGVLARMWHHPRPLLRDSVILALLCLPCAVAVSNAPYLWTDVAEVQERGLIATSLADGLRALLWGVEGHYYRPTVFALHSANYWALGPSPIGFRLTNLVLHVLNAVLVYHLTLQVLERRGVAFASGALFGVHPVAITPIAWVSDRTDLLALQGCLAFSLAGWRYVRKGGGRFLALAFGALLLGIGAKESAAATLFVTAPCVLVLKGQARRRMGALVLMQLLIVGMWFAWRSRASTVPDDPVTVLEPAERVAVAVRVHAGYVLELLTPHRLTVCDATRVPTNPWLWGVGGLCCAALLLAALRRAWSRFDRRQLLPAVWAVAFLLPTMGLLPLKHVRADRYLYGPLPGLAVLAVAGLSRMVTRRFGHSMARGAAGAAYLWLAASSMVRARHFASDETLWGYELKRNPDCTEGLAHLARHAYLDGRLGDAAGYLQRIPTRLPQGLLSFYEPNRVLFYRGLVAAAQGQTQEAERSFRALLKQQVRGQLRVEALYHLGLLAFARDAPHDAEQLLTETLEKGAEGPTLSDALLLRAFARFLQGNRSGSVADLRAYERRTPEEPRSPRKRAMVQLLRSQGSRSRAGH
jgi:tetratricopeptide (TPR) repeat protein